MNVLTKPEEGGTGGKIKGSIISIKAFCSGFFFLHVHEQGENQVQLCVKNVDPHPRGELQLTLHLPTRRHRGTRLSGDWPMNPTLAIQRSPGPLITSGAKDGS